MDLNYSAEDIAFRDQVSAYLDANLPKDLQQKVLNHKRLSKDDFVRWHKIVAKQGWVGTGWPVEYGGTGWNAVQRHIWEESAALAAARFNSSSNARCSGVGCTACTIEANGQAVTPPSGSPHSCRNSLLLRAVGDLAGSPGFSLAYAEYGPLSPQNTVSRRSS